MQEHSYGAMVTWAGAGQGTTVSYEAYSREYEALVEGKPPLRITADGAFLGDAALHNSEDLLVISLSGCHLLTYLWQCSRARLHVLSYTDEVSGVMIRDGESYRFSEVVLAEDLRYRAHGLWFSARSVNFPVRHEPMVAVGVVAA